MSLIDVDSRERALDRMMTETGWGLKAARSELNKRLRQIKCIIALWGYYTWARDNGELKGGPKMNSVKYQRVEQVLQGQCYSKPGAVLCFSVWDLVDLSNERLFLRYADQLLVPFGLQEILLLGRRGWDTLKTDRSYLVSQRKKLDASPTQ